MEASLVSSPTQSKHPPSDFKSISNDILTPRTRNDQYETEKRLRTWIEESLELRFEEKNQEKQSTIPKSAIKKQREESSMFYYNLESGYILCKILEKFFHSTIDSSKINEFDNRMYFLNENQEAMKSTNYLAHAKANIKLFLDGVRRIDGFPVLATFTFEDLSLQQNKPAILGCLSNLQWLATKENDVISPQEDNQDRFSIRSESGSSFFEELVRLNTTDSLPPSPSTASPSSRLKSPTAEALEKKLKEKSTTPEVTVTSTVVSVFTLPIAIAFALAVVLYRVFTGKSGRGL